MIRVEIDKDVCDAFREIKAMVIEEYDMICRHLGAVEWKRTTGDTGLLLMRWKSNGTHIPKGWVRRKTDPEGFLAPAPRSALRKKFDALPPVPDHDLLGDMIGYPRYVEPFVVDVENDNTILVPEHIWEWWRPSVKYNQITK